MINYTFNPPEEELISHYLNNKITQKDNPEERQINEVNICHYEPADLPGLAKIESSHTWYFISPVEKFGRLNRTKRASRSGHWKITGNSRTVKDFNGNPIGLKKILVFQENKRSLSSSKTNTQQDKTNWIIHEFHSFLHHPNQDAFVLCKLMKKTRSTKRSSGVADASPAMIDLSLTSVPVLNPSQMVMENKNTYDDLEDLLPEFDTTSWFDNSYLDHFHWETYTDIAQSLESGESSGENSQVYGPKTTETSNGFSGGPPAMLVTEHKNNQI